MFLREHDGGVDPQQAVRHVAGSIRGGGRLVGGGGDARAPLVKRDPSRVSDSLRVVRCSSGVRSRCSNAAMRALTTDFDTPSFAAAAVNERASTTRAKYIIASTSSGDAAIAAPRAA